MISVLRVKGMSCQHCVMSITKALGQLEGVKNVNVDLQKGEVRFENTKGVASAQIEKAITDAGYEVIPQSAERIGFKSQMTNSKSQISSKFQFQMTKTILLEF